MGWDGTRYAYLEDYVNEEGIMIGIHRDCTTSQRHQYKVRLTSSKYITTVTEYISGDPCHVSLGCPLSRTVSMLL